MMGISQPEDHLFDYRVNLDKRMRPNHPLRRINEMIDFTFVRERVAGSYGYNGNISIDPAVIMKMMFLLFYDDVASERELMWVIGERLDYMWFLGYGLNDKIPNHSVLSKARARWGTEVFEELFVRIVGQCVKEGLVDGAKVYLDGCLVDANASRNSVVKGTPEFIKALKQLYRREEEKLEEKKKPPIGNPNYRPVNEEVLSTTDPDAAVVRQNKGEARPRYKNHRVIDDAYGVITAQETTSGDVKENRKLMDLLDQHEENTGLEAGTVVTDRQYGTADNFRDCYMRGIRSHMGDLKGSQAGKGRRAGIYSEDEFIYDVASDTYRCPAGQILKRRKHKVKRKAYEYSAGKKVCRECPLRSQCTRSVKSDRTIKRHENHEAIEAARAQSHSAAAKRDRIKRKWLMEGSFADAANNHGLKRARWRRLRNQRIQDCLIATIQNIRTLINNLDHNRKAVAMQAVCIKDKLHSKILVVLRLAHSDRACFCHI